MRDWLVYSSILVGLWAGTGSRALAERDHEVRAGQTLASIARQYHVTVGALKGRNGLDRDDSLRPGQVLIIPDEGTVFVQSGQTLARIARNHNVSLTALARANRIDEETTLQVGRQLVLPGHEQRARAERRWGQPRSPGVGSFSRLDSKTVRIRLVDSRRRVRSAAVRQLTQLLRSRRTGRMHTPPRRLLALLARVSDHFGGRTIHIVSGYRHAGAGYTRETSRHTQGRAIDFNIEGVPNTVVRNFLRSFENVGVGYYPHSSFVHLDVRDHKATWVDWSGHGEPPKYRQAGDPDPARERAEREQAEHDAQPQQAGNNQSDDERPSAARIPQS